ncbi:MAG: amidohydrolase family protein [Thermoguttaceae bacterium]
MPHIILVAVLTVLLACSVSAVSRAAAGDEKAASLVPDAVFYHGKIVTVDDRFSLAEALAVRGERIVAVGRDEDVLRLAGPRTRRVDLGGKTAMPGLIDSHLHLMSSAMYEFDHEVPQMDSIADVLAYVRLRAGVLSPGEWISIQQVFVTRLRERRFPTRQELDQAAPRNPVCFSTGPDAALNSMALRLSGIDKDFKITDGQAGQVERDPRTGEPTGMLRNCHRFIKLRSSAKTPTAADQRQRLKALLAAYNEVGITSVTDRDTSDADIEVIRAVHQRGELTCRVYITYHLDAQMPWEQIRARVRQAVEHPLRRYDNMLWLHGIKIYLDGGMLTGSAYMREPWGVSRIYSITDPQYRGLLFIKPEKLVRIARLVLGSDLQLTAHCVGDGAVETLVSAYEQVNREFPVRPKRPCMSHANFMTLRAIRTMQAIGVVADLQPIWLLLDGATLGAQFGDRRLEYFQPYKSFFEHGVIVGGGSDHMQKIGRRRSINSYDPFLGMWITLVRQPRWTGEPLHPEQAITRQQAIRLYTINCAFLTFEEKEKGSLEKGKLADFIVLDKDILTCPVDEVKDIEVGQTWLGGKQVFARHAAGGRE